MPRTVEHIVACHQAATQLRKAGKPIWSKRINVRALIQSDQDNETPEHVTDISNKIAKLIRSSVPASFFEIGHDDYNSDFVDIVENMEQCTVEILAIDKKNGVDAVDMFNDWMEQLYDWADYNRVWLG
jgi:hypothetical protein